MQLNEKLIHKSFSIGFILQILLFGLVFTIIPFMSTKDIRDIKNGDYIYVYATVCGISEERDQKSDELVKKVYVEYIVNNEVYASVTDLSYLEYNIGDQVKMICDASNPKRIAYEDETLGAMPIVGGVILAIALSILCFVIFGPEPGGEGSVAVVRRKSNKNRVRRTIISARLSVLGMGVVFLLVSLIGSANLFELKAGAGATTQAVITDIDRRRDRTDRHDGWDYDVFIRYEVEGQVYDTELNIYDNSMRVGQTIEVIYEIGNPRNVTMDSPIMYIMIGCGVFLIILGIVILIMPDKRRMQQ